MAAAETIENISSVFDLASVFNKEAAAARRLGLYKMDIGAAFGISIICNDCLHRAIKAVLDCNVLFKSMIVRSHPDHFDACILAPARQGIFQAFTGFGAPYFICSVFPGKRIGRSHDIGSSGLSGSGFDPCQKINRLRLMKRSSQ